MHSTLTSTIVQVLIMNEPSPTVYACDTCHARLAPKICKSNKNGNAGKVYVSCHTKSRDGTHCSYYSWLSEGVGGSPPSSPALSMPSSSPPLSVPPATQPTQLAATLSSTQVICAKRGCGMGRLHFDCPRKMCRRHCVEADGCRVKSHLATNIVASTALPSFLSEERLLSLSPSPSNPMNPPPSVNLAIAGSSTTADLGLDFFANPHHASQIVPAFTQQYALEQALEESKRAADAKQLANIEKAKHSVIVYGWARDDQDATIFEVQGGFKWPHFVLSAEVLGKVDLLVGPEDDVRIDLYNVSIGRWTKVQVGQVVLMKDRDHVFVRGTNIRICLNFDELLSESKSLHLHFLDNLPQERSFVRQALKERKMLGSSVAINLDDDEGLAVVPRLPKGKTSHCKISHHKYSHQQHSHDCDDNEPELISTVHASSSRRFGLTKSEPHHLARMVSPVHTVKVEYTNTPFIDLTLSDDDSATAVAVTIKNELDPTLPNADSPQRHRTVHKRAHSTSSSASTSSSSLPSSSEADIPAWPSDFYAVDIVYGFEKCESASRVRGKVEETFEAIFKTPFRRTTFYKHRKTWLTAPATARDAALKAGHTSQGLWVYFLKQIREETVQQEKEKRKKKLKV
ncbi:hypothetical protein BYT27DRAFT_6862923 [Phlegmacium glaucopus]|nr:hypothetical protein BYT27DRAFT_6862923 [Phlegmacium glaucopus]